MTKDKTVAIKELLSEFVQTEEGLSQLNFSIDSSNLWIARFQSRYLLYIRFEKEGRTLNKKQAEFVAGYAQSHLSRLNSLANDQVSLSVLEGKLRSLREKVDSEILNLSRRHRININFDVVVGKMKALNKAKDASKSYKKRLESCSPDRCEENPALKTRAFVLQDYLKKREEEVKHLESELSVLFKN